MTLKVGIIGAGGYWAKNYIRIVQRHPDCVVESVCDSNRDNLNDAMRLVSPTTMFAPDYKMLLNKDLINCAIVCTPVSSHYGIVGELLNNGIHVLCEKAVTDFSGGAKELIEIAEEGNVVLAVGQTYYYNSMVQKVKQLLDENYLGDVYYVSMTRVGNSPKRNDCNSFWDLAPHDISMLNYWFGLPKSISLFGKSYLRDGLEDFCVANLELQKGVIASIKCSWLNPVKRRVVTIVGSKKMLVFDDIEKSLVVYEGEKQEKIDIEYKEPLKEQVNDFIASILYDRQPLCGGKEGLDVVKVLEAGTNSLKNNSEKVYL